ncbi:MAG TPA: STAS/SEC14 domain-containing protein [Planctomycetaceae bacterium]|nr:STAS/SEC14 domain-containing protein [Blastopirellula sp.]HAY82182.1 STAS/SEC14 domain-containing protein [Planctomycetaceae bacterium]|tara:strand:+ start:516 stop:875 length:360 start_codon:yes stop_codon:yes gene_type:complete
MAIELSPNAEAKTLEVKASGKLSAEDYETLEPGVSQLIENVGKIKILFVMHDFHGWDVGAVWEDIKFATHHCNDIEKVAMVGETTWEKWMASICKPFTMSTIKYFDANEQDAAREWLTS